MIYPATIAAVLIDADLVAGSIHWPFICRTRIL